ncbi:MAG TPA: hypothetical protein VFU47_09925 [Armatimonadota bacterium]|nr:hypothetical protein [Armatimonadota bacterium]
MDSRLLLATLALVQAAAQGPGADTRPAQPARAQEIRARVVVNSPSPELAALHAEQTAREAEVRALEGKLAGAQGLSEEQRRDLEKKLAQAREVLAQTQERLKKLAPVIQGQLKSLYTIAGTFQPLPLTVFPSSAPVDLDIDNATVADAARQIVEKAKLNADVVVDPDVPADARFTLRAKNVRPGAALDLLAQSAGAGWALEKKDGKTTLRLGKKVRGGLLAPGLSGLYKLDGGDNVLKRFVVPAVPGAPGRSPLVLDWVTTQRSTFTCPHCKNQATVLRQRQAPKCPKCNRVFQPEWQFCPADGTKRPATTDDWRFCPFCGKRVETEKSEGDTTVDLFPVLWDGPAPDDVPCPAFHVE